jgi:type II secretory pathway component PulJ
MATKRLLPRSRARMRRRKAASLIELLAAVLILAFVMVGVAVLYQVNNRVSRRMRNYSLVQTDLRTGVRRATRTIRHGTQVVVAATTYTQTVLTFTASASRASNTSSQVTVCVPDSAVAIAPPTFVEVRLYLSNGTLYAQRADEGNAGTAGIVLLSGISAFTITYWNSSVSPRATTNASPQLATEVELSVTAAEPGQGAVSTSVDSLVSLRNYVLNQ